VCGFTIAYTAIFRRQIPVGRIEWLLIFRSVCESAQNNVYVSMTLSANIFSAISMEYIILSVSLLKLGKLVSNKCLVYFMTNRAVYDTFVLVLLLSICRLFLHLTIVSQLCPMPIFL
jgi:hypothetical protein